MVSNKVVWAGNPNRWQPPAGSVQVVDVTTPAKIWQPVLVDSKITDWVLGEQLGAGDIGFTWNGAVLTTNQPKPDITATGTQTL